MFSGRAVSFPFVKAAKARKKVTPLRGIRRGVTLFTCCRQFTQHPNTYQTASPAAQLHRDSSLFGFLRKPGNRRRDSDICSCALQRTVPGEVFDALSGSLWIPPFCANALTLLRRRHRIDNTLMLQKFKNCTLSPLQVFKLYFFCPI